MKTRLLILFLLFFALVHKLQMQEIPDCMCVPLKHPPSGYLVNQDSAVVLDTCGIWFPSASCDSVYCNNVFSQYGIEAMQRVYAKSTWTIWFDVKAFLISKGPVDTIIEVTWRDIDSLNYPFLKDSLELIEQNYGSFTLRKIHPQYTEPIYGQEFIMYFEEYVNVFKILDQFRSIPHTYCDFISWLADDYSNYVKDNNKNILVISPNPASEYIEIDLVAKLSESYQIQIFDVYGKEMYVGAHCPDIIGMPLRIDISSFPDGVYFLRIGNETQKFVVIK